MESFGFDKREGTLDKSLRSFFSIQQKHYRSANAFDETS